LHYDDPLFQEMKSLNDYFGHIYLINRSARRDRLDSAIEQSIRHNFVFTRFEAHDLKGDENRGCSSSHRGVLELICHHGWQRTLILEDDFRILHDNMTERFFEMIPEVPSDWGMCYLGAGYAEVPQARVSEHVIRAGHLKTTSSYAITYQQARKMAPFICGSAPIDEQYRVYNQNDPTYIFDPRLFAQSEGFSDIEQLHNNHSVSMCDPWHVRELDLRGK
jgi:GR25 family glycosyltransferase involved in LPS biosynthesis